MPAGISGMGGGMLGFGNETTKGQEQPAPPEKDAATLEKERQEQAEHDRLREEEFEAMMPEEEKSPDEVLAEEMAARMAAMGIDPKAFGLDNFFDSIHIQDFLDSKPPKYTKPEEGTWDHRRLVWITFFEKDPWMKMGIFILVMMSVILLALDTNDRAVGKDTNMAMAIVDAVVVVLFILEIGVKLLFYGKLFFHDVWNDLDMVVTILCIVELVYRLSFPEDDGTGVHVIRITRALRVFRFFRLFPELKALVEAFVLAFAKVLYVMLFLLLILYMFALIATLELGVTPEAGSAMAEVAPQNWFGSVQLSMITLFQIMTGDSWVSQISRSVSDARPSMWPFFLIFYMVAGLGVLNLFTAVIIEELDKVRQEATARKGLRNEAWRHNVVKTLLNVVEEKGDPDKSGDITATELHDAMEHLMDPKLYKEEKRELRLHAHITMNQVVAIAEALINSSDQDKIQIRELEQMIESHDQGATKGEVLTLQGQVQKLQNTCNGMENQIVALGQLIRLQQEQNQQMMTAMASANQSPKNWMS